MTCVKHCFEVRLTVRSPFLFRSLETAGYGVDATALRDVMNRPIIPGDHLKGHLRHALRQIQSAAPGASWAQDLLNEFGAESPRPNVSLGGEQNRPIRANLVFSDLIAEGEAPRCELAPLTLPRVAIAAETGAAKEGMLQMTEIVAPPELPVLFHGTAVAFAPAGDGPKIATDLVQALRIVPAIGSLKSVGFGEVLHAQSAIEWKDETPLVPAAPASVSADDLSLIITFDRPILIDAVRTADNVFTGSAVVPGSALKGAIARAFALAGDDPEAPGSSTGDALAKMIIGHAYPLDVAGQELGRALPDSLVGIKGQDNKAILANAALAVPGNAGAGGAYLLEDGLGRVAAQFPLDWKPGFFAEARKKLGRPAAELPSVRRGQVAIHETSGIAADQQLYVTVARDHRIATANGFQLRRWRLILRRNGADAMVFGRVVAMLQAGVDGVGATGAQAKLAGDATAAPATKATALKSGLFPVLLETPAVMTDPDDQRTPAKQYQDYFSHVLKLPVTLVEHFARRRSAGDYLAYRRRAYGQQRFQPFEVTEAGAVFLLKGDLSVGLADLVMTGLPAVRRAGGALKTLTWRECPFVAENGYGAISIDPAIHPRFGEPIRV